MRIFLIFGNSKDVIYDRRVHATLVSAGRGTS